MKKQELQRQNELAGRPEHARRLFIVIIILCAFGVLGGIFSLRTSIQQPLSFTRNSSVGSSLTAITNTDSEAELLAALKDQDSDQDNLSNYDELYQYGTSPYLADSDSDGISDDTEITNGQDPNCPEGQECSPIAVFQPNTDSTANTTVLTNESDFSELPTASEVDVNELRTALRNAGAPQSELDAISDEELLTRYQSVLESGIDTTDTSDTNTVTTNSDTTTEEPIEVSSVELQELISLTPQEIRDLLIANGADEELLNEIDDETLHAIFLESVQNLVISE